MSYFEKIITYLAEYSISLHFLKYKPYRYIVFRFCGFTFSGLIDILVQAQEPILWENLNTLSEVLSIVRTWID